MKNLLLLTLVAVIAVAAMPASANTIEQAIENEQLICAGAAQYLAGDMKMLSYVHVEASGFDPKLGGQAMARLGQYMAIEAEGRGRSLELFAFDIYSSLECMDKAKAHLNA